MLVDSVSSAYFKHRKIFYILILLSWLVLPLPLWLVLIGLASFIFIYDKYHSLLMFILIFSLSFLVSSRYVGLLWAGSDDMPSYFLAYLNYDELKWIVAASVKYARHADLFFSLYSWAIAKLSGHHLFIYYFTTVFLTYVCIWKFLDKTKTPHLILSFLFIVIFFKYFQLQWHLIRSVFAIPILLIGILTLFENKTKGRLIFVLGGLMHFSTMALSFPLFLFHRKLGKVWSLLELIIVFIGICAGILLLIASAKLLSSFSSFYIISKIVSRLTIEPSFTMAPFLLFFIFTTFLAYPVYKVSEDAMFTKLFNISFYYLVIGFIAMFIAGKELYRFIMPLFLLYSPLLFKSIIYFKQRDIIYFAVIGLFFVHTLSFSYVVSLNESQFYYLEKQNEPMLVNGIQSMYYIEKYIVGDIEFYSGYRQ